LTEGIKLKGRKSFRRGKEKGDGFGVHATVSKGTGSLVLRAWSRPL